MEIFSVPKIVIIETFQTINQQRKSSNLYFQNYSYDKNTINVNSIRYSHPYHTDRQCSKEFSIQLTKKMKRNEICLYSEFLQHACLLFVQFYDFIHRHICHPPHGTFEVKTRSYFFFPWILEIDRLKNCHHLWKPR